MAVRPPFRMSAPLAISIVLGAMGGSTAVAVSGKDDAFVPPPPCGSYDRDAYAVACSHGWTVEQARAQFRAERQVRRINGQVARERPDIFVGAALSPTPGGAPSLYLKGPAPDFVKKLVAAADVPIIIIIIVDEQPFSRDELQERASTVIDALVGLGFESFATSVDITGGGRIPAAVSRSPGVTDDPAQIIEALPAELRSSVDLSIVDSRLPRDEIGVPAAVLKDRWGPLAVAADPGLGGLDAGYGPGRLVIGPECVTLKGRKGVRVTLVWRSGETAWDPVKRQILYADRDEGFILLSEGDRLLFGGAALAPPDSPDQGAPQPRWLVPPDDSCPQAKWVVHEVNVMKR